METQKKPATPYKSMSSRSEDNCLILDLQATKVEDTIRFAYGLHLSLLPVVHKIYVWQRTNMCALFAVNEPNHGE